MGEIPRGEWNWTTTGDSVNEAHRKPENINDQKAQAPENPNEQLETSETKNREKNLFTEEFFIRHGVDKKDKIDLRRLVWEDVKKILGSFGFNREKEILPDISYLLKNSWGGGWRVFINENLDMFCQVLTDDKGESLENMNKFCEKLKERGILISPIFQSKKEIFTTDPVSPSGPQPIEQETPWYYRLEKGGIILDTTHQKKLIYLNRHDHYYYFFDDERKKMITINEEEFERDAKNGLFQAISGVVEQAKNLKNSLDRYREQRGQDLPMSGGGKMEREI